MNINNIKVGMKVVPVSSTHSGGTPIEEIRKYRYMTKGYLMVCEVDNSGDEITIWCWKDRIHTAWGREMYVKYKWLKFTPKDLEPLTKNHAYFLKYKKLASRVERW